MLKKKDTKPNKNKDDLIELSDLRNAIVHKYKDGIVLTEPNEITVNLIKEIKRFI